MGSHGVTCHPTQVNTPCLINRSQTDRYSIHLPRGDRRLSWPSVDMWLWQIWAQTAPTVRWWRYKNRNYRRRLRLVTTWRLKPHYRNRMSERLHPLYKMRSWQAAIRSSRAHVTTSTYVIVVVAISKSPFYQAPWWPGMRCPQTYLHLPRKITCTILRAIILPLGLCILAQALCTKQWLPFQFCYLPLTHTKTQQNSHSSHPKIVNFRFRHHCRV